MGLLWFLRRRIKRNQKTTEQLLFPTIIDNVGRDNIDIGIVITKIDSAVNDLKNSAFFTDISSKDLSGMLS
jgi:hypothetical protein